MKKAVSMAVLASAVLFSSVFSGGLQTVGAVDKNAKAHAAYEELLTDGDKVEKITGHSGDRLNEFKFALLDMNEDGVEEMVLTPDDGYHVEVFSYVKEDVKMVGSGYAGGQEYYPNKHLYFSHTTHMGADEYYAYRFNRKKMKLLAQKVGSMYFNVVTGEEKSDEEQDSFEPYEYKVKGKVVSEKKYEAYIGKLLKGAKEEKPKLVKNSAKNRKKYL